MSLVDRRKAAIKRGGPSLPIKCLVSDELIYECQSFFDYGCGYGEDIRHVAHLAIASDGWDPALRPHGDRVAADAVNLGYVLNVIEDQQERAETLQEAWKLASKVLSVAARIVVGGFGNSQVEYGDGILTRIGTFQKYYTQSELRDYIETVLEQEAIPAAPGVYYVFRDDELREQFLASRYRRRTVSARVLASEKRFEEHRELLEPLVEWVAERGRPPEADEFPNAASIVEQFGSINRALSLIRRVIGTEQWQSARRRRSEDLLVFLALSHFRKRPRLSQLPIGLQRDVRALFGTYTKACDQADSLLFRAGDADAIDEACRKAEIGKLLPNALYVHVSALDELEPLLRIYEGCAKVYLGDVEGANIVKLHRFSGKVSYLAYPEFDTNAHPILLRSFKVALRSLEISCYDYGNSDNPPILHRKESFLAESHPLYDRFACLTRQEERHGLLDDTSSIGTRAGWEGRLETASWKVRGHRLVRR